MVGSGHVLAFFLLIGLPLWGYRLAVRHDMHGLLGFGAGLAAFAAVISGNLLRLMLLDFLERKKYPNRAGVGRRATVLIVLTFAASVTACIAFYRHVASA